VDYQDMVVGVGGGDTDVTTKTLRHGGGENGDWILNEELDFNP
jgi:hypothetical protein